MVRRLAFPAPPPQWYGLVGVGGGGGLACAERWSGRLGGVLLWAAMGHSEVRKPCASHKPYIMGRVPVLISLNLYFIL